MIRSRVLRLTGALLCGAALWLGRGLLTRDPDRSPAASAAQNPSGKVSPAPVSRTVPAELKDFETWAARYLVAAETDRAALITEGETIAERRRPVMKALIRTAPEAALAAAVPMVVREKLPPSVVARLEERVSGRGDVALMGVVPAPGRRRASESVIRSAVVAGREYRAYTYGRRAGLGNRQGISLNGIAVDGALAVDESPVRVLEPGEHAGRRPVVEVCPVSGTRTPVAAAGALNVDSAVAVEAEGEIKILCQPAHTALLAARYAASEERPTAANSGPGTSGVVDRPTQAWTHGTKKVLVIRVDFPDRTGTPVDVNSGQAITDTFVHNVINGAAGVRVFFEDNSYGKTTLSLAAPVAGDSADVTPVLRLTSTAASYATAGANTLLHSDAEAAASAAGFILGNYDRIGVVFSDLSGIAGSQIDYGGLGNITGTNFWVNGFFEFSVVAHELGHTFGLHHSNLWQVTDGNPVSAAGSSTEYGDIFDIMGDGGAPENHFSHWNKSILQWIPDTAVKTIDTAGTYRVYRFDAKTASLSNTLALKIVRNDTQDYWIGHRRATTNAALDNGACVLWGYNTNQQGNLLDLATPGAGAADSALQVGQTFTDSTIGLTLKTLARGGTGVDEWIDVQTTFQPRVRFKSAYFSGEEYSGQAILTLERTHSGTGAVSVNYTLSPGTATAPADYTGTGGTVSWANGDLTPKTITIPLVADSLAEGPETFTATLSTITGGLLLGATTATVQIAEPGVRDAGFVPAAVSGNNLRTLVLQPDGLLLAGGYMTGVESSPGTLQPRAGIARFFPDGRLDTSFAAGGGLSGAYPEVWAMARQPDGRVVIGGSFTGVTGTARANIARLLPDGSLDATFNPGTGADNTVSAVLVQPDGKILVGGAFAKINGTPRRLLARLNPDGSVDATFTPPGFFNSLGGDSVTSLALQPDGLLVVGGYFALLGGGLWRSGLCRVTPSGALDTAFDGVGNGAYSGASVSLSSVRSVNKVVVLDSGSILVGGNFSVWNGTARGGLARLSPTGALDTTFTATTNKYVNALLVQPDGRIMVGGNFTKLNGTSAGNLGRLESTGALDASYYLGLGIRGFSAYVYDFSQQPDGQITLCSSGFATLHDATTASPLWRLYTGQSAPPGAVQLAVATATGLEGTTLTLTATRTGGSLGPLTAGWGVQSGTAVADSDFPASRGVLTWASGDTAPKTISIPITSDTAADIGETFFVNLGQPLIGATMLGPLQQATVTITTPFAQWQAANFNATELANPAISGDLADPDRDGRNNLLEFALHTAPRVADAGTGTTRSLVAAGGSNYLALTCRRLTPAGDLTYTVQNSGDITAPWTATTVLYGTPVNNGDGTETVTYRDSTPLGSSRQRFLRLQVLRAP